MCGSSNPDFYVLDLTIRKLLCFRLVGIRGAALFPENVTECWRYFSKAQTKIENLPTMSMCIFIVESRQVSY